MTPEQIDDFLEAFSEALRMEAVKARIDAMAKEIGAMRAWQDRSRAKQETVIIDGVECTLI